MPIPRNNAHLRSKEKPGIVNLNKDWNEVESDTESQLERELDEIDEMFILDDDSTDIRHCQRCSRPGHFEYEFKRLTYPALTDSEDERNMNEPSHFTLF